MAILKVKVVPGSSSNKISGWENGYLKVKIAAPPEKGKANDELIKFFSRLFGVRKNQIKIKSGHTSRLKLIEIEGVKENMVDEILNNR